MLFFLSIDSIFMVVIAFWAILFTEKYPKGISDFVVGTFRWAMRLILYMGNMTDTYPAFTEKVLAGENQTQTAQH